jgi:hypothetical protein
MGYLPFWWDLSGVLPGGRFARANHRKRRASRTPFAQPSHHVDLIELYIA